MEDTAIHADSKVGDACQATSTPKEDTSLYSLSPKQAEFFKAQTGINDNEDLKKHILEVQAKAYKASCSSWT